jgi:hypothetical protein
MKIYEDKWDTLVGFNKECWWLLKIIIDWWELIRMSKFLGFKHPWFYIFEQM